MGWMSSVLSASQMAVRAHVAESSKVTTRVTNAPTAQLLLIVGMCTSQVCRGTLRVPQALATVQAGRPLLLWCDAFCRSWLISNVRMLLFLQISVHHVPET